MDGGKSRIFGEWPRESAPCIKICADSPSTCIILMEAPRKESRGKHTLFVLSLSLALKRDLFCVIFQRVMKKSSKNDAFPPKDVKIILLQLLKPTILFFSLRDKHFKKFQHSDKIMCKLQIVKNIYKKKTLFLILCLKF